MNKTDKNPGTMSAPGTVLSAVVFSAGILSAQAEVAGSAQPVPLDVAEVFIELNNTDGDLGIHSMIDGEPWEKLEIRGPDGERFLKTQLSSALRDQGLTEYFFESAEPNFDEVTPEEYFERFPPGTYSIRARALEGFTLQSETEFTHEVPAPADTYLNGMADTATECDEEEPGYDPLLLETPVTISWDPVTMSHPDLGGLPVVPVTIVNYEVVVEIEVEVDGENFDSKFSVILPPEVTSMEIPADFMDQADGFVKYEVLARETSFNQTAVESCFLVGEDEE